MINIDYPYIVAWGRWLSSNWDYVQREVIAARSAGAPNDAIYRNEDGVWITVSDIDLSDTRQHIIRLAGNYLDAQRSLVMDLLRRALDDEDAAHLEAAGGMSTNTYRDIEQALGGYR